MKLLDISEIMQCLSDTVLLQDISKAFQKDTVWRKVHQTEKCHCTSMSQETLRYPKTQGNNLLREQRMKDFNVLL